MTTYLQDTRRTGLSTPLGKDVLLLSGFEGQEPIDGLFSYQLQLLSENDDIQAQAIVGQQVSFWVEYPDGEKRCFCGSVNRFEYVGRGDRLSQYRATVVPWLWFLSLNSDCRIFQHKTVPEIIREVLKRQGCANFDDSFVRGKYPALEYCVQYNESDFAFISRLMEASGICYFFRHEEDRLVMILADTTLAFRDCKDAEVRFDDNLSERNWNNEIWRWDHRYEFKPGKWAHKDFNFKAPKSDMLASVNTLVKMPRNSRYEVYEYPGDYELRNEGDSSAKVRIEAEESAFDVITGESSCRSFSPGARFLLTRHHSPRESNKEYILTSVQHSMNESSQFVTGGGSATSGYENVFTCIPSHAPYRPVRKTETPRIRGPQTAEVVGPAGEEIYTDEFGRVKVQFHWDREGERNENSSCWMRVSQVHAGDGWGMMDLPRIGEEVIVSFLEGNPDRPIITGRVYNAVNMPPFSLPAEKSRRGNMTKTYKGAGYNEMSMDDTKGAEQIRINSQYNMNSNVNNDQTLDVGNNQTEQVAVNRMRKVGSNEAVEIGADQTLSVAANQQVTIGSNQVVGVGANQSITVGSNILINAGTSITLKCGASMIHMNQAGVITISGTLVSMVAAINANVAAPITNISGAMLLTQTGMINLTAGVVTRMDAAATAVVNSGGNAAMTAGGDSIVQGATVKLN